MKEIKLYKLRVSYKGNDHVIMGTIEDLEHRFSKVLKMGMDRNPKIKIGNRYIQGLIRALYKASHAIGCEMNFFIQGVKTYKTTG